MTGPRRLSQAISEGDGISLIVAVRDAAAAQRAEAGGAEALLAEDALDAIRASTALPIVTSSGSSGDARIVCPGDEDVELGESVELVVQVEREEELDEALERFDPELFVLAAPDGDGDRLEHVLDLLSDLPAGKLAIADLRDATQPEIDELERAGVDAVLVPNCRDGPRPTQLDRDRGRGLPRRCGAARARDRGEPRARALLRQLALRLGRADRGRPRRPLDRLLDRRRDRRPLPDPTAPRRDARCGLAARARDPLRRRAGCSSTLVEWDPGPRLNPLLATIFLFGAQSVILGTVSPIAVRLKAPSVDELGRTAGRLFAISTAGSIAGTFATAFWLIPELGTDQVLASAAVALMLAAAAVALVERLLLAGAVALALAVASVGAVVSLAPDQGGTVSASQLRNWSPVYRQQRDEQRVGSPDEAQSGYTILHTKDSQYHRIAVVEDDDSRYLRFDSSFQSGMYKDDPYRTRFEYSDYLQLPLAYRPSTRRILYIGLGGGSAPKRTWRDFPATRIDVVELDPEVVDVAYEYFDVPRDPRLRVEVEDGRRFLAANEGPWDAIVIDAFYSDSIPFHLATREFLELARSRLTPGRDRLDQHHRRRARHRLPPLPLDAADLSRRLPDGRDPPRSRSRRQGAGRDPQHHPRRRRRRGTLEGVPARALGSASEAGARRA